MNDALGPLAGQPFFVMDGAGNDFVVVDLRDGGAMSAEAARALGDRDGPFGCDQVITLTRDENRVSMAIWNADGSEAGACGNAARCVADILMTESGSDRVTFGSPSGDLAAALREGLIEVDMGIPRLAWSEIPVAREVEDTRRLPLSPALLRDFDLPQPAGVSMGNPHAVFLVEDAEAAPLEAFGPLVETDPFFPDRVNCSVASIGGGHIRLRTWERGVGITKACGTAACAALVSAHRLGLSGREAEIRADGGTLRIRWPETSGRVLMAGPTRLHRRGVF